MVEARLSTQKGRSVSNEVVNCELLQGPCIEDPWVSGPVVTPGPVVVTAAAPTVTGFEMILEAIAM